MDTDFRESVHHDAALYLQVPLLILPFGCTGRFLRTVERQAPVRHGAWARQRVRVRCERNAHPGFRVI